MDTKGTEVEPGRLSLSWRDITVETTKSLISRSHKTILRNGKRFFRTSSHFFLFFEFFGLLYRDLLRLKRDRGDLSEGRVRMLGRRCGDGRD